MGMLIEREGNDPEWLMHLVLKHFPADAMDPGSPVSAEFDAHYLSAVDATADAVLTELLANAPHNLNVAATAQRAFEGRLQQMWGKGLDLLELLILVAHEAGEVVNERDRPRAALENDAVFEALVRLHARGCQVAREALCLLRSGYAAGAHSRWRTLHEIAATALFVRTHGADTAERYLLHEVVE